MVHYTQVQAWLTIKPLHLWARALATENVSCATIYLKYLFNNHSLSLYHYYQSLRCANAYTDICTTPYEHAHTLTTGKSYSAITCNVEKRRRARPKHRFILAIRTTCGMPPIEYEGGAQTQLQRQMLPVHAPTRENGQHTSES